MARQHTLPATGTGATGAGITGSRRLCFPELIKTGIKIVAEGGVEGFLADEASQRVLDGERWGEYADVLTGYVFLEQNTYYILNHDRYY